MAALELEPGRYYDIVSLRRSHRRRSRPVRTGVFLALVGVGLVALVVGLGARKGGGSASGGVLAEGSRAPRVVLASTTGEKVDLARFRGKRNVLLYFYEHAG